MGRIYSGVSFHMNQDLSSPGRHPGCSKYRCQGGVSACLFYRARGVVGHEVRGQGGPARGNLTSGLRV